MLQGLSAAGHGVFLVSGTLEVTRSAGSGEFEVVTSHGSARLAAGSLSASSVPWATRLETTAGEAVVRAREGAEAALPKGCFIVYGQGHEQEPRSIILGLAGQWLPGRVDGRILRDVSGRGWDGVFIKPPPKTAGRKGSTVNFDGQQQFDVAGLSGSGFPRAGTLSFWVRLEGDTDVPRNIVDQYDTTRRHLFVRTWGEKGAGLQVAFQQKSNDYLFVRNVAVPKGQWMHFALAWDAPGRKATVYLNGAADYGGPIADPAWTPGEQLFAVGGGKLTGAGFLGQLDDVRLYSRPLSADEVRELAAP
jgi:hypothetical protein